jgi:uncharacterized protein YraI
LNLRSGPGTEFELAGRVGSGIALPIIGRDPAQPVWWQVRASLEGGEQAVWVFGELVRTAGPMDTVPVVAAPITVAAPMTDTLVPPVESPTAPEKPTFQPRLSHQ